MSLLRLSTRRAVLAALLVCATSLAALAQEADKLACNVRVTLLQVNDVYQFTPADRGARGGLARVSTLHKSIARQSPHTLFILAGDTISPSVESITYKGAQMIDAWNTIGLDFSVFGNHEFDFGPDVLRQRMSESKFKWLGANVFDKKTGKTFGDTPAFVVREFGGVKVGLFGITLPETQTTSSPGPDVEFRDACETAKQIIPQLRAAGANTIVAVTHLSMREDKQLARCAAGQIDVIVGGHEHTLLESSSAGTPIFKMTADGREMGRIDLNINSQTGKVESLDWEIMSVTGEIADDPDFAVMATKYGAKLTELATRVGMTSVSLDARSAANRTGETNIADYVADAFRQAAGADVALLNGGSIRADSIITPGELTLRDVLSILPFNNELVKIEITGETLRQALEHGVSRSEGNSEPGRFPQISGVRYAFDTNLPAGARLSVVTVNNQPLDLKRSYTLVTAKYLADGGDQYAVLKGHANLLREKLIDAEVLRKAIAAARTIAPMTDGRIRRLDKPAEAKPCGAPASGVSK